jgi:hypothetical protein
MTYGLGNAHRPVLRLSCNSSHGALHWRLTQQLTLAVDTRILLFFDFMTFRWQNPQAGC